MLSIFRGAVWTRKDILILIVSIAGWWIFDAWIDVFSKTNYSTFSESIYGTFEEKVSRLFVGLLLFLYISLSIHWKQYKVKLDEYRRSALEVQKTTELTNLLLNSLPYPALLIRFTDAVITAANKRAIDMGAKINSHCWSTFAKGRNGNSLKETENGLRCSFCRAHELLDGKNSIKEEVILNGRTWETWWLPVREDMYLHVVIDITEKKNTELKLKETTITLETMLDTIPDIIVIQDKNKNLLKYNRAGHTLFDFSKKSVIGEYCFNLLNGKIEPTINCPIERVIETKKPVRVELYVDYASVWLDIHCYPVLDEQTNIVYFIHHIRDITQEKKEREERRELEEHMRQSSKLEAIGTLASGIAHEFNNLLQEIQSVGDILKIKTNNLKEVNILENTVERGSSLINQLLTFTTDVNIAAIPIDINKEIERMALVLERLIPRTIKINLNLQENLKIIRGDAAQIDQVLVNLCLNARDALSNKGTISISTKNITLSKNGEDKEYILLNFEDSGCGITQDIIGRIFEPFFSTKGKSREHAGLGLAVVYGIVKAHNANITCHSEVGKGTCFSICFPVVYELEAKRDSKRISYPTGNQELVLLVDDEEGLCDLGGQVLGNLGYSAIVVRSGEEAIKVYKERKERVSVILLDLIMPGMGGYKCAKKLVKMGAGDKIILSVGFPNDEELKELQKKCNFLMIKKPWSIIDVANKIGECLSKQIGKIL